MGTLGQRIIRVRVGKRMKQKELTERAGLSQRYVSAIENDHVDPRLSIVQRIAEALGVSVCEIVQERPQWKDTP